MGKADPGEMELHLTDRPQKGLCFACGWHRRLERCHINAKVTGGSDEVSNLHLLCGWCHRLSEGLEGEGYWEWLRAQDQVSCLVQMLCARYPEQLMATLLPS